MHRLGRTDGGEVAVTLIGEDDVIGQHALDTGRDRGCTTMCSLDHVAAKEVVAHDRAADRRDADGLSLYAELVDGLGNQTMHDTVSAARAEVGHDG